MKKYLTPILIVIVSIVLLVLSSCTITSTPNDSPSDGFVSPDEFISMNIQASNDHFTFPFTMDDVKTMQSYVCPLLKQQPTIEEFTMKMWLFASPAFPELSANDLGVFAAYVVEYACLSNLDYLKEAAS